MRASHRAAPNAGPRKRRRSAARYHATSTSVTAAIVFPACIWSGIARIIVMNATQTIATRLIVRPNRPRCQGPRGASIGEPRARQRKYTGAMYARYRPITLIDVTTAYVPLVIVAAKAVATESQIAGAGVR